jgi:hypothetical protein
VHSIQICHQTGVKLSIKEHETNPNLKNIELEGSFEQIAQASKMVEELVKVNSAKAAAKTSGGVGGMPIQEATIRPCLFPGIHFPGNHFLNFPVFVYY